MIRAGGAAMTVHGRRCPKTEATVWDMVQDDLVSHAWEETLPCAFTTRGALRVRPEGAPGRRRSAAELASSEGNPAGCGGVGGGRHGVDSPPTAALRILTPLEL